MFAKNTIAKNLSLPFFKMAGMFVIVFGSTAFSHTKGQPLSQSPSLNNYSSWSRNLKDQSQTQSPHSMQQGDLQIEIYGFILTDVIYDFQQMDPKWFDVPRPTKLPAFKNQFAPDGQVHFSVRDTRFGLKSYTGTPLGELKSLIEFDFFGSGPDAGQTTIHLRHAYAELGKIGAGQTWSVFMDPDLIPHFLEYWGPNGMVFMRNIQLRYMPIQGESKLTFAIEKPGATADEGIYADRIELNHVEPQFALPDLSTEYRYGKAWGYVELAGIIRQLKWKDLDTIGSDLSGRRTGWGFNLSSKIKCLTKDVLHLQVVYGKGIENYIRDAPADIGIQSNAPNSIEGVTLPVLGLVGFYDHYWNNKWSTTIGYSQVKIWNSNGQSPDAFNKGGYALTNLMYHPIENVFFELELQYTNRKNFSDDWNVSDPRIQFSFSYNFSQKFYHEIHTSP